MSRAHLSRLAQVIDGFLVILMFGTLISQFESEARNTYTAYDCDKATVAHNNHMSTYLHNHSNIWLSFRFLMHHLHESPVTFAHGTRGNETVNHVYVTHNGEAFVAICPPVNVTVVTSTRCYADGVVEVVTKEGNHLFMATNKFLIPVATPVTCQKFPLETIIKSKIHDHFLKIEGNKLISFAIHKSNTLFDFTRLVNNHSMEEFLLLEEKNLNHDNSNNATLTTLAMLFYRRHAVKIQGGMLAFRIALDVILFVSGLACGLPLLKSTALASSSIKKVVDFKNYLAQNRLNQQEQVLRIQRQQLGRDPNVSLSEVTSNHLSCMYEAIIALSDRCKALEEAVSLIHVELDASRTPSRSPSPSTRSQSNRSRSNQSRRSRLPARNRVRITTSGVAFRVQ